MEKSDKKKPAPSQKQKKPRKPAATPKIPGEEKNRLAELMQASEEKFRRLFETAQDGILLLDADTGVIAEANPFIEKLLGYTHAEIVGKKLGEIGPFINIFARQAAFRELQKKKTTRYEYLPLETSDGRPCQVELISNVYRMGGQKVIQCNIRDITQHIRLEEERKETKDYWQSLIDNTSDLISIIDSKGIILYQNHAVERLLGYKPAETIGKNKAEFVQADDMAHAWNIFETSAAMLGSKYPIIELRIRHKDGTWRIMETTGETRPTEAGGLVAVLSSRDITERKQAEIERQTLLEIMQGYTLTEDMQEYLRFVHQAIARVILAVNFYVILKNKNTGMFEEIYSVDEYDPPAPPSLLEKSISAYVFRSGKPLLLTGAHIDDLAAHGKIEKVGTNSRSWLGVPLITSKETIGVMAVQDYKKEDRYSEHDKDFLASIAGQVAQIVERKQAEEEIRQLNADLEKRVEARTRELGEAQEILVRQEKLAVLGQLAGSVGHELRNPLSIINNAAYYLRMIQPQADEKVKEYLGIIEHETRTADKIITDLLEFSRTKSVDKETVEVAGLIQQVLERFPPPEEVEVTTHLPEDLPSVDVDAQHLTQVLGNLVVNACQAMTSHGSTAGVAIHAPATGVSKGGQLTITAAHKGKEVSIAVRDSGVGIPPENLGNLFEPLFTTKLKGIGLGLAVSQKLMEANDGRIEVQSEPGRGSTFTVFLPVHKESA